MNLENLTSYLFASATGIFTGACLLLNVGNSDNSDWIDRILGPFGALVLSLLVGYIAFRFIKMLLRRNHDLYERLLNEKDKRLRDLERRRVEKNNPDYYDQTD